MNVDSIRAFCLSFPESTEKLQWGDALCFKVRTKMFAVLGLDHVRLTFKCSPEEFAELSSAQTFVRLHTWPAITGSCSTASTPCPATN